MTTLRGQSEDHPMALRAGAGKRAGNARRDRTISELDQALSDGVLPPDVHQARVEYVLEAQYADEMDAVTLDLPKKPAQVQTRSLARVLTLAGGAILGWLTIMFAVPVFIYEASRKLTVVASGGYTQIAETHSAFAWAMFTACMTVGVIGLVGTIIWLCAWWDGQTRVMPKDRS